MSTSKAEAVYRRPKLGFEDNDPDSWHDLAICDAYDRAVDGPVTKMPGKGASRVTKSGAAAAIRRSPTTLDKGAGDNLEQGLVWSRSGIERQEQKTGGSRKEEFKARRSVEQVNNAVAWRPGDKGVALYSEDGLYYDCVVVSTNKRAGTCVVEFDGYGNRDTVNVEDVYSPETWNDLKTGESTAATSKHASDTSLGTSSCSATATASSSTEGTSSDVTQDIYVGRNSKKKKSDGKRTGRARQNGFSPMGPPGFHMGPVMGMPPPPPFMAHGFPGGLTPPKAGELSDDALASMLMSWYMAGYHTGYYQGLSASNNKRNKRR